MDAEEIPTEPDNIKDQIVVTKSLSYSFLFMFMETNINRYYVKLILLDNFSYANKMIFIKNWGRGKFFY